MVADRQDCGPTASTSSFASLEAQLLSAPTKAASNSNGVHKVAAAPLVVLPADVKASWTTGVNGSVFAPHLHHALRSVVKIFTTTASPNFSSPWQMQAQTKCTATGFVVEPLSQRRILTNAHAVANQLMVMVRKHGNATKFNARVLAVGHECDIAMLTVDDEAFWSDVEPLEISGLPAMQEEVTVVGFPTGGDNACVTKGVVSRIDRQQYSHGRTSLLAVQIDAAINSGNSGGPVLHDGKVVGIAFQCLTSGENIGYIIPVPVINHFLQDLVRNGKYTGFCDLGVYWQCLENSDMKAFLRMPSGMTGVYVTKVEPLAHAAKVLQSGDVITHFNGEDIADDGTFLFQQGVRIDFRHLVSLNYDGDTCKLMVWRGGQHLEVDVVLNTPNQLVPIHSHDVTPEYFIYAGLVFTKLSTFYLKSQYGADWQCKAPIKLCEKALAAQKEFEGQEIVILAKVMAADINAGYQDISNIQVKKVNGVTVHNLAQLAQEVTNWDEEYVRFDTEWSKVLIINNTKAKASSATILRQNCVPAACTPGLLEQPLLLPAESLRQPLPCEHEPQEGEDAAVCSPRKPQVGQPRSSKM